jgi:hypothetical protein
VIRYVKDYEKGKPNQHPVGMVGYSRSDNHVLEDSPGDWVSPGTAGYASEDGIYKSDPPAADRKKVSILDTEHIWGVGGVREWVWKSFFRGHNPVWMDPYDRWSVWEPVPVDAEDVRRGLGDTRLFAERMNLAAMTLHDDHASTTYCLAEPGKEYLVYLPEGGKVTVDLSAASGMLAIEWMHPADGTIRREGAVAGRASACFRVPSAATAYFTSGRSDQARGLFSLLMSQHPGRSLYDNAGSYHCECDASDCVIFKSPSA